MREFKDSLSGREDTSVADERPVAEVGQRES
jgi:hypothetical protein